MMTSQHSFRTTIIYGLICGLSFIPANLVLTYVLQGPSAICLTLWLYVAGYSLLLSRWGQKPILNGGFSLLLLFATSFLVHSIASFYFLSLVVISWIRSGIYFGHPWRIKLLVELLLCALAAMPVVVFTPGSAFSWMLGIWMLFLIQSLYFVIFENRTVMPEDQYKTDPFEHASRQAEAILSDL